MIYPKISIVTPSFGQVQYLDATIRSVLDQEYPNLEYIIIDGGSTDGSVEIIKKYEKHLTYWVSEKDRGQSHAINKGFMHVTGEWSMWLNSDDRLAPGALARMVRAIEENPGCGMLTGANDCDEDGYVFRVPVALDVTLGRYAENLVGISQPATLFRTELFRAVGGVAEDLHYVMDVDLWLKMLARTRCVSVDEALSVCAIHEAMKSKDAKNRSFRYAETVLTYARGGSFSKSKELGRVVALGRICGCSGCSSVADVLALFSQETKAAVSALSRPMAIYAALQDVKQTFDRLVRPRRTCAVAVVGDGFDERAVRRIFSDAGAVCRVVPSSERADAISGKAEYVLVFGGSAERRTDDRRVVCFGGIGDAERVCREFSRLLGLWRYFSPECRAREFEKLQSTDVNRG